MGQKFLAVIDKNTKKVEIFKEKTQCSKFLGISSRTLYRKLELNYFEVGNFEVYTQVTPPKKSNRGGKR